MQKGLGVVLIVPVVDFEVVRILSLVYLCYLLFVRRCPVKGVYVLQDSQFRFLTNVAEGTQYLQTAQSVSFDFFHS